MSKDNEADTLEIPLEGQSWPDTASSRIQVELGATSHVGHVRHNNEDCFLVARIERRLQTLITNLPAGEAPSEHEEIGYGMLVADGMGGAAGGEVASRETIATLVKLCLETPDWHMRLDTVGANEVLARMDQRIGQLREALVDRAARDPSLAGMGTTLTLALSLGANLIIVHVGDSRAYLFRDGKLQLLTRDQTLAQDLAEIGVIRPEDVSRHGSRHILTGVISTIGHEPQAELFKVRLVDGDQVLLCTDGLTEMVAAPEIVEVLEQKLTSDEACQALVDRALDAGGVDNVTVVLARYRIPEAVDPA